MFFPSLKNRRHEIVLIYFCNWIFFIRSQNFATLKAIASRILEANYIFIYTLTIHQSNGIFVHFGKTLYSCQRHRHYLHSQFQRKRGIVRTEKRANETRIFRKQSSYPRLLPLWSTLGITMRHLFHQRNGCSSWSTPQDCNMWHESHLLPLPQHVCRWVIILIKLCTYILKDMLMLVTQEYGRFTSYKCTSWREPISHTSRPLKRWQIIGSQITAKHG